MLAETFFRVPTLHDLRRGIERVFDDFPTYDLAAAAAPRAFPALNIWEDGDALHAEAEVPGLTMGDIDVTVIGNELTIKGLRKPIEGTKLLYHRQERGVGAFSRSLTLPFEVNPDAVEATLKDGVLTIRLPKSESARARRISVKAI